MKRRPKRKDDGTRLVFSDAMMVDEDADEIITQLSGEFTLTIDVRTTRTVGDTIRNIQVPNADYKQANKLFWSIRNAQ